MVQESREQSVVRGRLLLFAAFLFILSAGPLAGAVADTSSGGESSLTPAERQLVASVPRSTHPLDNRSGIFDTRFSVAPHAQWRRLFQNPQILKMRITSVPGKGAREVSETDVQGVFPVAAKYYFAALTDYSSYPRVSQRTVFDAGRGTPGGRLAYHKRIQKIAARFLGFGDSYLYVTNNYPTRLGSHTYGLKWNLERSLDGKFFELLGSWYVKQIRYHGRLCSYVRYFNKTGFIKRPAIPNSLLGFLTSSSYRALLGSFYHEALALQQKASSSKRPPNDLLTLR